MDTHELSKLYYVLVDIAVELGNINKTLERLVSNEESEDSLAECPMEE